MKRWSELVAAGILAPIDLRFANFCRDLSDNNELLTLSAALLSYERAKGNSCVCLPDLAGKPFPSDNTWVKPGQELMLPDLPELADWRAALADSDLVGDGTHPTPLVLRENSLYLYRYWQAERTVEAFIRDRLNTEPVSDAPELQDLFTALFQNSSLKPDYQAAGALAALQRRFTIITGGPGTGKTTTVVKMLALLLQATPRMRIALAAPTGKAASRLGDSITRQVADLPAPDTIKTRMPTEVKTLHRLLGFQPRVDRFYHNPRRPLPYDTVVVDEASMVDLLLMDNLLKALPHNCRLVLIGDHDQLASVDTGFVLGDITRASKALDQAHGTAFGAVYQRFMGHAIPVQEDPPVLRDNVVRLNHSFRFQEDSGIGELSKGISDRNSNRVWAVLSGAQFQDVTHSAPPNSVEEALAPIAADLDRFFQSGTPEEAVVRFAESQILCARRNGTWGVDNLNAAVERRFMRQGQSVGDLFYRGRPILITHNDYQNKLFNGDIGICWPKNGAQRVWFQEADGSLRDLPISRLPAHETAWAMTIHKNQGSEFDRVLLFLPEAGHNLCNRELFYTGVTRAKQSLHLTAEPEAVKHAVHTVTQRFSGLTTSLLEMTAGLT